MLLTHSMSIGHAVRCWSRTRWEVGAIVRMSRATKPYRRYQEGTHRRGGGSEDATDHGNSQNTWLGQGSAPEQSGMRSCLTSTVCLTIVSTSTQRSLPEALLPQGKGRVG